MAGGEVDLETVSDVEFEYDDWNEICQELSSCNGKWRNIAVGLGLSPDQIDEVEENGRRASDRLQKVIQLWIEQNYNTQRYGLPSWRTLCKALQSCDGRVFKQVARKHPGPTPGYTAGRERPGSGSGSPLSFEERRLTSIPQWGELSLLKYMKDGKKQKLNIISRASPKWKEIAERISTRQEIVAQASQKYRDDSIECLRHVLNECFIKNTPANNYSRDWYGIIEILEDVDEEQLSKDVRDAVLRK